MHNLDNDVPEKPQISKIELVKGWGFVVLATVGLISGVRWLFFTPSDSKVFVIQEIKDDCFNKLLATSENGPDKWSMKVCISANNGYVDENGEVIHP